ncbi:hypothetical protein [Nocardiopsis kunsanensis]|uniref:hypothetical protein n=1 Tax=Nocardiopsis kunsanensis TaxID=141693 RepID=UPI0003468CB8|nr:hypothetical protein [Nocardiopsis kunsanensis]
MGRTRHQDEPGEPDPDREPGETGDRSRAQEDESGRSKKIDLSLSQVAGAGGATLTAATAASYLDVYGTVIGTAVMAILSTSASPLFSHWFSRSGEQARQLAGRAVAPKDRTVGTEGRTGDRGTSATGGTVTITEPEQTDAGTRPTAPGDEADSTRTMSMPVLGADLTQADREATRIDGPEDMLAPEETTLMPAQTRTGRRAAPHTPASVSGNGADAGGAEEGTGDGDEAAPAPGRRGWRAVLIPAALVFTAVMLVILAFELLTGRSLTSWTRGTDEPTAPSIMGGESAPAPEEEPAPGPEEPESGVPSTEEPGLPEQQPTREPEPDRTEGPETEMPEGGNGTEGDGDGTQPTPSPDGQENTPPSDEGTQEDPGGSDPPLPEPGDNGQGGPIPEQQSG